MSPRAMAPWRRAGPWLAMAAAGWLGACWGDAVAPDEGLPAAFISNPILTTAAAGAGSGAAGGLVAAQEELVYASLAPDSFPDGRLAVIGNPRTGTTVSDSMVNGGLDPVPVAATGGDTVTVDVFGAAGPVAKLEFAVPEARKPRVVRVSPPRKKRDVVLNAPQVIFFTEPVAANSVTPSSVRLLRGDNPVDGTVRLLVGTGAVAAFVPTAALDPNTEYRVLVTQDVRDLEGESLEASYTSSFTTGQSLAGAPARIRLSPDTVVITGLVYQMSAFVEDDDGNILIDEPIAWSTSDQEGLAVSATGRLYALVDGRYSVFARSGQLEASALVIVRATAGIVTVLPQAATVAATDTVILRVTVQDVDGRLLQREVTWTSNDNAIATVAPAAVDSTRLGIVGGVNPGTAMITATSGPISGTAVITVTPLNPVASLALAPAVTDLLLDSTLPFTATPRDAAGRLILRRPVWTSLNQAVATVDTSGLVKGVGLGSAAVVATLEGMSDTAQVTVTAALTFTAISTGIAHTCALTQGGTAYCWGRNHLGQLGDGTTTDRVAPVRVLGGLRFTSVSPGPSHTCGVTADENGYCWGANWLGRLGDGTTSNRSIPVLVSGGRRWKAVQGGSEHTCGLATDGIVYCWGWNSYGALGDGSASGTWRASPGPVLSSDTFAALSTDGASFHTCALTTHGAARCWGRNFEGGSSGGQLGDGTITSRSVPTPVKDTLTFATLTTGSAHTCGLTRTGAAYCWGFNTGGQLGDGTTDGRLTPVATLGDRSFSSIAAGSHTCALTAAGGAYCWGPNSSGELGDGTTVNRLTPVLVSGGLTFSMLSAGGGHTCGLTTTGTTYCWGYNWAGQLGNGSTTDSSLPVKVAGQP